MVGEEASKLQGRSGSCSNLTFLFSGVVWCMLFDSCLARAFNFLIQHSHAWTGHWKTYGICKQS